jgi:hypothetical protein
MHTVLPASVGSFALELGPTMWAWIAEAQSGCAGRHPGCGAWCMKVRDWHACPMRPSRAFVLGTQMTLLLSSACVQRLTAGVRKAVG